MDAGFVRCALLLLAGLPGCSPGSAQTPSLSPLKIGGVAISGSFRTRVESWDWFAGNAENEYTYPGSILRLGLSESRKAFDWQVEFALPFILGLPEDAIAPGSQGQLGFGATYLAANGRSTNAAMLFPKQGYIRFAELGRVAGQSLKLGRMEFIDGTEVTPKDATLAALKRDRVANRLIGNFGFSDVGRSMDGVQYVLNRSRLNFTFLGARPTRGVFQVDGWGELNANVFYGAFTGQKPGTRGNGEWRMFTLGYSDYRDGVVKTDNRPLAVRAADARHIHIATFGGHYLQTVQSSLGTLDLLVWGVMALADRNDLWYSGGGMFQPWTFGYFGRPANGQVWLATLWDASADYSVNTHFSIGAYYGHATGKRVVHFIYPNAGSANFGYLEFTLRL